VTTIRLGTVRPEWDGKFEIALPDFYKQSSLRDGAIQFILRDPKTEHHRVLETRRDNPQFT